MSEECINRDKLRETVAKLKSITTKPESLKLSKWTGAIEGDVLGDVAVLYIHEFGLVKWPLDYKEINKMVEKFRLGSCCQINASQVTLIPRSGGRTVEELLQNLAFSVVQKMLNVTLDCLSFNIEAKLEKIVICSAGESHSSTFSPGSRPGKFGNLLLQVPVIGDQPCGSIVLCDGTKESIVKCESNTSYSAAAVAGHFSTDRRGCFTIQSDAEEITAVMVFSLVWNDEHLVIFGHRGVITPSFFPLFLLHTHEIKETLTFWECETNPAHREKTSFKDFWLCLPLTGLEKELTLSNLTLHDKIVVKSLMSITFLNVYLTHIELEVGIHGQSEDVKVNTQPNVRLCKPNNPQRSMQDDLFQAPMSTAENLVYDLTFYDFKGTSSAAAIVIQPRNPKLSLFNPAKVKNKEMTVILARSLEERLNGHSDKENRFMRSYYSKELKRILNMWFNHGSACATCFLSHIFNICIWLKDVELAHLIFNNVLVKHCNAEQWPNCVCTTKKHNTAETFARFICFVEGWQKCPDVVKQLMKKFSGKSFHVLSDIGLYFLQNDYQTYAQETFQFIRDTLKQSRPEEVREMFDARLAVFTVHLYGEDEEVLDELAMSMKHLKPEQLTELAVSLFTLTKEESLDCTVFLKCLGRVINQMPLIDFTPEQFLKMLEIVKFTEQQTLMECFWKSMCTLCVQLFNSDDPTKKCLLCEVLKHKKSAEVRSETIEALSSIEESKEALRCSLQKLKHQEVGNFDAASCIEYIDCIVLLEEPAQLSPTEIVQHFSDFFGCLNPKMQHHLSMELFKQRSQQISVKSSTMRNVYESLLKQSNMTVIIGAANKSALIPFAWYNNITLVRSFIEKLDGNMSDTGNINHTYKISVISAALKATDGNNVNAASSLNFTRDIFNYLMLESLKSLASLAHHNRDYDCSEYFKLMASSERSFIDSTKEAIVAQWTVFIQHLSFLETVRAVKRIVDVELPNEGPNLKKFPSCWQVFTKLCYSTIAKWDAAALKKKLSEGHLVPLMQSFLWIGDEKGVADLSRLLHDVSRSVKPLADVHRAIIKESRTVELAMRSTGGVLGLNELVDTRIQILGRRLAYLLTENTACSVLGPSHTPSLALPSFTFGGTISQAVANYTEKVEAECRWTDGTVFQKEIDELLELRKTILRSSLSSVQASVSSNA